MFCPKCRYEYEPHIFECPDCGEKLVVALPDESGTPTIDEKEAYADWVPLVSLNSPTSAQMVMDVLRQKNIPAVVLSGGGYFGQTGSMGPSSQLPIKGNYTLMVPEDYVADADGEGETILGDEWREGRLIDLN